MNLWDSFEIQIMKFALEIKATNRDVLQCVCTEHSRIEVPSLTARSFVFTRITYPIVYSPQTPRLLH